MTTDVTLYRNWRAIRAITNPHLFLFVALGSIQEILECLSPVLIARYFTEEKPERDGPWPLSVIKRIVEESLANLHGTWYEETLERMGVPVLQYYAASAEIDRNEGDILVLRDAAGVLWEISKGGQERFMPVVIEGVECLLLNLSHCNSQAEPNDGPRTIWGHAVPRTLIDENA